MVRLIGVAELAGALGLNQNKNFDEDLATLLELLRTGELRPEVAARLPLSEAAKALQMLIDRTVVGKIILLR